MPGFAKPKLKNEPVIWYDRDTAPISVPEFQEPGLVPYAAESFVARPFSRFFHPGRFFRRIGTGDPVQEAGDINSLDEVVNSTWFTNRIGIRPLSDEELAAGPALGKPELEGPDRSEPWTIIGAKTAGVTPGFRIRDARGKVWLLKFDPPSHPGMTIRTGVVANLFFHAMGFNTPVDRVVSFNREDLVVGEGAMMRAGRAGKIPMTEANLDSILVATRSIFDGEYQALASQYLDGNPLGPFDDQGRRKDDPNDRILHQDRRELRALRVLGGWLNHFDTKMHNSLDMYHGEPEEGHVRHYLIDFASTLGSYGDLPVQRFGYEYGVDVWPMLGRTLALGFHEDTWVKLERPAGLDEVGLFDSATFEPDKWKPDLPHSAMANLTERDGYWAAKIVSSFTDHGIRVLVEQGRYQNPAAVDFLVRTMVERRDKIARYWFDRVPPLDFFRWKGGHLDGMDLAVERNLESAETTSYRYRYYLVDEDSKGRAPDAWVETPALEVPLLDKEGYPLPEVPKPTEKERFLAVEFQVNRGTGWSRTVTAYLAYGSGRLVAVDR